MLYEAAIAAEIFGVDRSDLSSSGEWYDLVVCTADGAAHPWLSDLPTKSYAEIAGADSVVVPSTDGLDADPDPNLVEALRVAHERGVRVASLCTGAFVLAAAGLLDGRAATTHWMHADVLARRYPQVDVRADVLYIDDGDVLTSAGKTAALDLCIQFVTPPAEPRSPDGLAPTLEWARSCLDQPVTVRDLAGHAGLSTRQLARRMHAELRAGPLDWLHQQRMTRAQELLERTDAAVEQIAAICGMGTAATLRRHFHQALGVTPTAYRTTFRLG